jgi:serine/threonine-protein kinase
LIALFNLDDVMVASEELVGQRIGKYQFMEYLGYGAMARVYKAYHTTLDRYVAIKLLHPHFASDADFVGQFKREAKNLATLRHPNIVQVYDFDIIDDMPYMIMEYIDGPTLKNVIDETRRRHVRVSLSKSVRIIMNIGVALSYAHKRSMVHRDVKPSNVMLEKSGRVVLADFGLARLLTGKRTTISGTVKGTPAYMSPEQGLGKSGEARSDIYSLGVIFYELATGQLPFDSDNPLAIAMKHVNEPLKSPKTFVPELPDRIEAIIMKTMEKNPTKRYNTVDELLQDLRNFTRQVKTTKLPTAKLSLIDSVATPIPETNVDAQVSLHFVDTGQILNLERGNEYTIGRRYQNQPVIPDIDLTPFKAYEWGISRLHAKIYIGEDDVRVTDLGSSNGTWVNGEKLPPNVPHSLKHGEIFFLGKLRIQVLIYDSDTD